MITDTHLTKSYGVTPEAIANVTNDTYYTSIPYEYGVMISEASRDTAGKFKESMRFRNCKVRVHSKDQEYKLYYMLRMLGYVNFQGHIDGHVMVQKHIQTVHSLYIRYKYTGYVTSSLYNNSNQNEFFSRPEQGREITFKDVEEEYINTYFNKKRKHELSL